jgi:hypothetical protein
VQGDVPVDGAIELFESLFLECREFSDFELSVGGDGHVDERRQSQRMHMSFHDALLFGPGLPVGLDARPTEPVDDERVGTGAPPTSTGLGGRELRFQHGPTSLIARL